MKKKRSTNNRWESVNEGWDFYRTPSKIKKLKKQLEELWKKVCLKRDNYKCQYCGSTEDLQVHHIVSRKNLNTKFDIDNGITLCKKCHTRISLNPTAKMEFTIWFIKKYGIKRLENLQEKARKIKQWKVSGLESEIEKLTKILKGGEE